ncbi:MAG: VCBS repeat-containing protein [Acidobacteriales bacterium]|nr:VCBS repeat-containing protein [Terriglobales bacterium]
MRFCISQFAVAAICLCAAVAQNNPVPLIHQLTPPSATPGASSFSLQVRGFGFDSQSTVYWNGSPRATTYTGPGMIQASIDASDIAVASTAAVTVATPAPGGGTSNALYFPILQPNTTVAFGRTDITPTSTIYKTVVADFNNDGKPDIAAAEASPQVLILLGRGDGTFEPPLLSSARIKTYDLVAGDVNQDGNIDLVVTDGASGTATLLGDGQGHFMPFSLSKDCSLIYGYFFLADFNGDGALDVFKGGFSDYTYASGFVIALGNGDGSFPEVLTGYGNSDGGNGYPAVGDFDGDGVLDIVLPDETQIGYFHGNGDGSFEDPVYFKVDIP